MSFCPKCKSEYINGRTHCADCGTALVESLEDIMEEVNDTEPENTPVSEIPDEFSEENDEQEPETKPERVRNFVSKKEKYKDYQSTGVMFIAVAVIGIAVITLNLLGVITIFRTSGASSVLFYFVMYAMFIIFAFVGINSFKNAARIKEASVNEENFLQELNSFVEENVTASAFDSVDTDDISQEELYFRRTELIRTMISEKYPDIDAGLLELTIDQTYDRIFQ